MIRRTWKQWWWFVRYWLKCLAKDIERGKHAWEDQVEGEFWRMMYGPRMVITYHKSPGESMASHMTSQRVMPLEDIHDFTIGNWKKVIGGPSKKNH